MPKIRQRVGTINLNQNEMKKILFLACMACTLCLFSSCEKKGSEANDGGEAIDNTITIKGTITDYDDGSPVFGTYITIMPGSITTYSAEDGSYITKVKCTTENGNGIWQFTVTAQMNGYKTDRKTIGNIKSSDFGKSFTEDFNLKKE
jgi:hypothetical protein